MFAGKGSKKPTMTAKPQAKAKTPLNYLKSSLTKNVNLKSQLKSKQPLAKQNQQQQLYKFLLGNKPTLPPKNIPAKHQQVIRQRVNSGSANYDLNQSRESYQSRKSSSDSVHSNVNKSIYSQSYNYQRNSSSSSVKSSNVGFDKKVKNQMSINKTPIPTQNTQNKKINLSISQTTRPAFNDSHLSWSARVTKAVPMYTDKELCNMNKLQQTKQNQEKLKYPFTPMTTNKFLYTPWPITSRDKQLKVDQYPVPQGLKLNGRSHYKNNFYDKPNNYDKDIAAKIKSMHKGILKSPIVPEGNFLSETTSRKQFQKKNIETNIMKGKMSNNVLCSKYGVRDQYRTVYKKNFS